MSPALQHESTQVPVTAIASCGALLIAAEGPFIAFYHAKDSLYISSKRIFKAQAVHGISVYSEEHDHVTKLVIWGGRLVCALEIKTLAHDLGHGLLDLDICLSDVGKAPDWILDLAPRPTSLEDVSEYQTATCAAVTAHNALLRVTIERQGAKKAFTSSLFRVSVSELTSSSRSILYSAHLFWESSYRVLVAAGTAFGEIMYWSWNHEPHHEPASRIHRMFLGHEGSVFGVQISKELPSGCCQKLRRVIASCSDDRTIRIWDVSDVNTYANIIEDTDENPEAVRTRHTGFSNEAFDASSFASSDCLAIGWGHTSRVWTVQFLESSPCDGSLFLRSAGEDATARTWELIPSIKDNRVLFYKLLQLNSAAHHNGKNIWSTTIYRNLAGLQQVACGGADSKITASPLIRPGQRAKESTGSTLTEYTVHDVLSLAEPNEQNSAMVSKESHKSSKKTEFFRSYCFIDESTFLVTANSGKVLLGSLQSTAVIGQSSLLSGSTFVGQPADLSGYSVCASGDLPGVAFIAGAKGNIYMYCKQAATLTKIHSVDGKVGDMLVADISSSPGERTVALLVTLVGHNEAQLLYVGIVREPEVFRIITVPISELLTGSLITSMAHVRAPGTEFVLIGFRRGSIAAYSIPESEPRAGQAMLFRAINKLHGDETVTCLKWIDSSANSSVGHLLSAGRDGRLAVHHIDLSTNSVELVHSLILPIGPNIEGLYFHQDHLLVHGFSSKKWVLYDLTAEEEVMSVETGGAHRSWAYQPHPSAQGGTLVWTRASSMHICSQVGPSHTVINAGGHGREIKAVAVSPKSSSEFGSRLVATGAEDTDIKIFRYANKEMVCQRTLRKHTTGIQHLQWSEDGSYLFSSGGCEEFYIWRIRDLPSFLNIGIVCEHVYAPESEHSDLRVMSFDVTTRGSAHVIALVFSDSSIKVYRYDPTAAVKWQSLAKGIYFTSCLTQCIFISPLTALTVSTDGHAVVWPLSPEMNRPSSNPSGSAGALTWQYPVRIHQNSSKAMSSQSIDDNTTLIVSGGDDGSLAFLLVRTAPSQPSSSPVSPYASPPILVNRAHASAVTACATVTHGSRILILTSGNDQWVRLWEVIVQDPEDHTDRSDTKEVEDCLKIRRLNKIKTNVADVSSMVVFDVSGDEARILICGVGMDVIVVRLDWDVEQTPGRSRLVEQQ